MSQSLEGYWHSLIERPMVRQAVSLFVLAVDGNIPGNLALDASTSIHSKETAVTAAALTLALELPADRSQAIAAGSLLHDIGKSSCLDLVTDDDPIDPSDTESLDRLRRHPLVGKQIVELVYDSPEWAEPVAYIWGHHSHKRKDGNNFPTREDFYASWVKGEIGVQEYNWLLHYGPIVAYADVFNVLLHPSRRGYLMRRLAQSHSNYESNTTGVAIELVNEELVAITNNHGVTAEEMGEIISTQLDVISALAQQI